MIWDIVTFSNTATLNLVMNAIASIFSDGGYKAAASALMLFVVGAAVLSDMVQGGKELSFGKLLAGFVIYTAGFSTLTSVSIENRFDGTVEKIDNIPIAVAAPASLISNMGLWLAETAETAFTPLNYTAIYKVVDAGYMTPLKILTKYRSIAMGSYCVGGNSNSVINGINLCKSVPYFVSECSMVNLSEQKTPEKLYEEDFLTALRFDSKAHATLLFDGSGNSTVYDCQTASDLIINAFQSNGYADYLNASTVIDYARSAKIPLVDVTEDIFAPNVTYQSGEGRAFMMAMFNHQLAEKGQYAFYSRTQSQDIAENLNTSIQQRNYAWAVQGEMWYELVDKFMSIMEALIYALAPFIGLMLLTGSLGQKTFLLYLQMLAVIQLIPVMLVVTQSVIIHDFNMEFLALSQDKNMDVGSINYAMAVTTLAFDKMGIGGMMAATVVPGMAMALVTGSGMAIMGSIKGAAAAPKDTDAMPETHGQGGAIQNLGQMNQGNVDRFNNVWTDQALREMSGGVSTKVTAANMVSQDKAHLKQAQESYNTALSNTTKNSVGNAWSYADTQSMGKTLNASTDRMQTYSKDLVKSVAEKYSLSDTQAKEVVNALSVGLMASGTGANIQNSWKSGMSEQQQKAFDDIKSQKSSDGINAKFSEMQSTMRDEKESITSGNAFMDDKARARQEAESQLESATITSTNSESFQRALSMDNKDLQTQIRMRAHDGETDKKAQAFYHSLDSNQKAEFARLLDVYDGGKNATHLDSKTAFLGAALATANAYNLEERFAQEVWGANKPELTSNQNLTDKAENGPNIGKRDLIEPTNNAPQSHVKGLFNEQKIQEAHQSYLKALDKAQLDPKGELAKFMEEREAEVKAGIDGQSDRYNDGNGVVGFVSRGMEAVIDTTRGDFSHLKNLPQDTYNHLNEAITFTKDAGTAINSENLNNTVNGLLVGLGFMNEGQTKQEAVRDMLDSMGEKSKPILEALGFNDKTRENLENFANFQYAVRDEVKEIASGVSGFFNGMMGIETGSDAQPQPQPETKGQTGSDTQESAVSAQPQPQQEAKGQRKSDSSDHQSKLGDDVINPDNSSNTEPSDKVKIDSVDHRQTLGEVNLGPMASSNIELSTKKKTDESDSLTKKE